MLEKTILHIAQVINHYNRIDIKYQYYFIQLLYAGREN